MFYKIGVLKNFAKVTENTCAGDSVLAKLQSSRVKIYWEKDSGTYVPVIFKIFKKTYFLERSEATASAF